jgi:prolyl oligopeptidase
MSKTLRHALAILVFAGPCLGQSPPPAAPVRPVTDDYFGTKVVDDYRWMEESGNADLAAWMKAQNDYTRSILSRLDAPRGRMLARLKELDNAVPVVAGVTRAGHYLFFRQTDPGARTGALMVRGPNAAARRLLDPEKFTEKESHAAMDYFAPSIDGSLVAVGVSLGGSENSTIHVVETKTGRILPDVITRTQYGSPSWRADGRSFYYSRLQALAPNAPPTAIYENQKTFLHVLGEDPEKDRAVFGPGVSPDVPVAVAGFGAVFTTPGSPFVGAWRSAGTTDPPDVYVARASEAASEKTPWKKIVASQDEVAGVDSPVAIFGSTLYLLVQKEAPNRRLIALDLNRPDIAKARVVLPETDVVLDGVTAAADGLYVLERVGVGFRLLRVPYGASRKPETIALPYPGAIIAVDANAQLPGAVFVLGSWTRPQSALAYDPATGRSTDLGIMPRHPADFSKIEAREVLVPSTDGAQVPVSILCSKDVRLDGSHTAVLEGYGAYGISIDPFFEPVFLPFLERGGVVVFVHARGGGEFGEKWHLAGKKATKQNTIDDVVAAARYLIEKKYTTPEHLALRGTSAGGIAVGGAITQHPELFAVAIDNVGVTDMLRFQSTQGGAANVPEFGDVTRQSEYEWLYRVSAYHHVTSGTKYPAVMGLTGVNDPRVPSWLVAKFIARLQAASGSGKPVLLRVDYDAGHGFGSSRTQREDQIADEATFILWQTGDPEFQPK